ncbi:phosphoribosylaminoimidazolesuccinocarboxamide synthase, partial [Klebsiella pneumoniae]
YNNTGAVCGVALPEGLVEASRLPDPIFTPASKAALGDHDENISFDQVVEKVGQKLAVQLREDTLDVYARASNFAADRGIILADTKLEFGLD